ncbi:MAG TPA: substrate-binding domain-containing protein [Bacteroidia bacterium]|jgi:phosphate transport system substrate-binding protein
MSARNKIISCLVFGLILFACGHQPNGKPEPTDTTTTGEVKIVVDESYFRIFQTQIYTFESIYPTSKIHATYLPEGDALNRLMNDSCKVVVLSRDLSASEKKTFQSNNLYPISTMIAEDAIALIVHAENPDSIIAVEQVTNLLSGKDSLWSSINPKSAVGSVSLVFDSKGSANARYMKDSLLQGREFSKNVFALNSTPEVIEYVSKNKGAIGFIGVNWISDLDDPKVKETLKHIKVLAVSKAGSRAVKPEQSHIKEKDYPFTRKVYMISRQTRAGLGMGFVSFVAGEKGQLMMLKAGLIPGFPPERTIKIKY